MDYERKVFYQDRAVAETYFENRFTSPKAVRQHQGLKEALQEALASISGIRKLLDLPCGTGRFTDFFYEKGFEYIGVDISKEMLDVLAQGQISLNRTPALLRSDGEALALKDNSVDCIVCIRLFQLIPRAAKQAVLKEMLRVSAKWLILEVMYVHSLHHFRRTKSLLRRLFGGRRPIYDLDKDILNTGWQEYARVRVKHTKHWVGVYKKLSSLNDDFNRIRHS